MSEKIPVGMSAGGDNAYYLDCPVLEQKKAYAVCVHLGARYNEGNFKQEGDLYGECFTAIKRGRCPARDMRREEIEKGEALYYIPRPNVEIPVEKINKSSLGYARGWNLAASNNSKLPNLPVGMGRPSVERPAPVKARPAVPQPDPTPAPISASYADAINAAIQEETEKQPESLSKPKTLADLAKQMRDN